jgi:hypothetical protein
MLKPSTKTIMKIASKAVGLTGNGSGVPGSTTIPPKYWIKQIK